MNQHAADFRKTASALGHNVEDLGSITKELAGDAVVLAAVSAAGVFSLWLHHQQRW